MPDRSSQHHRERMADAIRDEISTIIEGELADPRVGLATVSEVQFSPDGRSARVFVSARGDDEEQQRTLEGVQAARNYIRILLAERLSLRRAPELTFQLDKREEYGTRIEQLLRRVKKRK